MSQTNIGPVHYYLVDPQTMGNIQMKQDNLVRFTVPSQGLSKWVSTLQKYGDHSIRLLGINSLASVIHPHVTKQGLTVFFNQHFSIYSTY